MKKDIGNSLTKEERAEKRPEGENAEDTAAENKQDTATTIRETIYEAYLQSHWAFQVAGTILSCFWTYALINGNDHDDGRRQDDDDDDTNAWNRDVQIVIMVVLVLTGVAVGPIHLFAPVGVGVFAGAVPRSVVPTYTALLVLSVVSAVVWRLVAYTQFLAGAGGRMGTTTFIAMNLTAIFFLIPFGHMPDGWNAFGSPNWTTGGDDTFFEWDKAVVLVCSTTFLSVAGAAIRIRAAASQKGMTTAVHPFLTPCAVALASDLVVAAAATTTATGSRLAPTAYLGFSVGSYVAMAALTKNLPHNEVDFFLAGLVAGLMGVLIDPFFVDFAGKAGLTAFLGYSTYKYIIMPLVQLLVVLLTCKEPKRELQQQQRQEESW